MPAQVEEDPTGGKFAGVGGALNSAHHKLEDVIQFHVGDTVTALQRAAMQPGGQDSIIYGTIMGALGVSRFNFLQLWAFPPCTAQTIFFQHFIVTRTELGHNRFVHTASMQESHPPSDQSFRLT